MELQLKLMMPKLKFSDRNMNKTILYSIVIIFLISCKNEKKYQFIPLEKFSKYYKIYPEFNDNREKYFLTTNLKLIDNNFFSKIIANDSNNFIFTRTISYNGYALNILQANQFVLDNILLFKFYKYLTFTSERYSKCFYQIEYSLEYDNRKKRVIFAFGDFVKSNFQSAYIDWSSRLYNDFSHIPYKAKLDFVPLYMWEINKTTDTITTNLSLKSIQQLYHEFDGVYIYKKYKEIILDYSFSTFDSTFYQNIKFIEEK